MSGMAQTSPRTFRTREGGKEPLLKHYINLREDAIFPIIKNLQQEAPTTKEKDSIPISTT
jgi:hypothetical protein